MAVVCKMIWGYQDARQGVVLELAETITQSYAPQEEDGWQWADTEEGIISDMGALVLSKVPSTSTELRHVLDKYELSDNGERILLQAIQRKEAAESSCTTAIELLSQTIQWITSFFATYTDDDETGVERRRGYAAINPTSAVPTS